MRNLTYKTIKDITGGKARNQSLATENEITAVVSDSRLVVEGCLFLCIEGENVDGHDYAAQAVANGAAIVLAEKELDIDAPYILVDSVLTATQELARFYRRTLKVKVVGISGSVGKTSTKEFIAAVLSMRYKVSKTKGNYNNQWGVPFTIFDIPEEAHVAVIEMGISDFGEMDRLSYMAEPDVVVLTNIGQSHLEFLKTRDGILQAKTEIFNHMNPQANVILNGDDDKLTSLRAVNGRRPEYFGLNRQCNVYAERIQTTSLTSSEFNVIVRDGGGRMSFHVNLPFAGKHMIYNALAATQVGMDLGVSLMDIKRALETSVQISGRNNIIDTEKFTIIDDCYNASPSSMRSSLELLQNAKGRKVAILGDMLELGENSPKYHFQVGQFAGNCGVDLIICVGPLSDKIFSGAKLISEGKVEYFKSLKEAMKMIPDLLIPSDTVLLKASNGMHFSQLLEMIQKL